MRRILFVFICVWLSGCATQVYQPGSSFEIQPAFEVTDDDIRLAYEARPQLRKEFRVAYFSYDPEKSDDIEQMLRGVPGVTDVSRIPQFLVTGEHRYGNDHANYHYGRQRSDRPLSVKRLRLLAARSGADALIVLAYGYRAEVTANGWVATSPLLLPMFFVPFLNTSVESYMDSYLIDVRNGYLYGEVRGTQKSATKAHTMYSDHAEKMTEEQWPRLVSETREALAGVVTDAQRFSANSP